MIKGYKSTKKFKKYRKLVRYSPIVFPLCIYFMQYFFTMRKKNKQHDPFDFVTF